MAGGRFFVYTFATNKGKGRKNEKRKSFKSELQRLLSSPASSEEKENLEKLSINLKNPTRMTVLAAALYKKAISGDLSSLKEILSVSDENGSLNERVILLDDIPK